MKKYADQPVAVYDRMFDVDRDTFRVTKNGNPVWGHYDTDAKAVAAAKRQAATDAMFREWADTAVTHASYYGTSTSEFAGWSRATLGSYPMVGDVVIVHALGGWRKGVVVKVTKTKVHGLVSSPTAVEEAVRYNRLPNVMQFHADMGDVFVA